MPEPRNWCFPSCSIRVLVHSGEARLKYGDSLFLGEAGTYFPSLTILVAPSGRGLWYNAAFLLARVLKNVYMEISGLPPKNPSTYFPALERNAEKTVFDSDFPAVPSIKANIEDIFGLLISDSVKNRILF